MITYELRTETSPDESGLALVSNPGPAMSARTLHSTSANNALWPRHRSVDDLHVLHRQDPMTHYHRSPPIEQLTPQAARWLHKLPIEVRPIITARRHPHVIVKLCTIWNDTAVRQAYFQELLFSSRPGRRGFSFEVMDELVDLQSFGLHSRR